MASYHSIAALLCILLAFFFSGGNALAENVLQTTLYITQTYDQDQRSLGSDAAIINWPIKDGPGATANTIGHAEGIAIFANEASGSWTTIMDLVFEGGSHAGSSLQAMGLHGAKSDQWSVIGGTGQLTMARGIISYNIIQNNSAIRTFKICIVVYYTPSVIPCIQALGDTARNP